MKLLRIKLTNYRGIAEREIEFPATGVTVVEGPNEIGKSCIAEAFDLVLEELDSSQKRSVLATKPVDRDAGPEVEAELETGQYHLRLHKRFVRKPVTELEILGPRHEHVTGRPAHERVRAILDETLDEGLWKALRIDQGDELHQPTLAGARSLAAALDRAAGTVPAGDEEVALYDRVQLEYEQYWTATGRPKGEHATLEKNAVDSSAAVVSIERSRAALEQDADRVASLDAEIRALAPRCAEQERRVTELQEQQTQLDRLGSELAAREAMAEAAAVTAAQTREAVTERQELMSACAEATEELRVQAGALQLIQPELATAREQHDVDLAAVALARTQRDEAGRLARLLRSDVVFLRDRAELATLRNRSERAETAQAGLAAVEVALEANRVDEQTITQIRAAEGRLRTARARLEVARPTVRVEALAPLRVQIDGVETALETGEAVECSVADATHISVPEIVAVSVTAGAADARLVKELQSAEQAFRQACSTVGVADLNAAELAALDRRRLEAEHVAHERSLAEALQGSTLVELAQTLTAVDARVSSYLDARPELPAIGGDLRSAEASAREAETAADTLHEAAAEVERLEAASRDRLAQLQTSGNEAEVRLHVGRDNAARLEERLSLARQAASDEVLAEARDKADREALAAHEAAEQSRQRLQAANAAQVPTLLANGSQVLTQMQQNLRKAQDERLQLVAQLRERGEAGLAERMDVAITARDAAVAALDTYQRRAAARRVLFERLRAARDRVRTAYVEPLTERVEALGRLVFGASFEVEIDEELNVVLGTRNRRAPRANDWLCLNGSQAERPRLGRWALWPRPCRPVLSASAVGVGADRLSLWATTQSSATPRSRNTGKSLARCDRQRLVRTPGLPSGAVVIIRASAAAPPRVRGRPPFAH
jgi:hypothetical protein